MNARTRRILVVDDDADILRIVCTMLEGRGWTVQEAASGEEALEKARRDPPDLILLDILMPRMNGLEVLRRVRELVPAARIAMITAFGDVESYLEAMDLGACGYLNKPFEPEELLALIDRCLPQHA